MESLIEHYFRRGHRQNIIVCYMWTEHGIRINVRKVRRVLRRLGLRKNGISLPVENPELINVVNRAQVETGKL